MSEADRPADINWVKNDPTMHNWFTDGSRFLVAFRVTNDKVKKTYWDFDVVEINCDGDDSMSLMHTNGEVFDSWDWCDFEYFHLIYGEMPTNRDALEAKREAE